MQPEQNGRTAGSKRSPLLRGSFALQSSSLRRESLHVALIMDGNGRWAERKGLSRSAGHREGAKAVRKVVESAARLGVGTLTLYAFSCDNWQRPKAEVVALMSLLRRFLLEEIPACQRNGVRVRVIGHRHRLTRDVRRAIERCEEATKAGQTMVLRLAVDYSAREQLARAACSVVDGHPEELEAALRLVNHPLDDSPPVDLLVRTSGEKRLSDFLLWECAYAELHFVDTLWPDFGNEELEAALAELSSRQRRFGRVPAAALEESAEPSVMGVA